MWTVCGQANQSAALVLFHLSEFLLLRFRSIDSVLRDLSLLLAAIREILDRTGYSETLRPTLVQIEHELDRLIEEAETELTVLGLDGRA